MTNFQKYQTYNTFDYPSQPAITDFSPRPAGRRNTQNKIQQVREKINDVISMANVDQKEGKTQFEGVIQGQRGILDLLKQGADADPALSHLYLPPGQGKYSRYAGPAGQGGNLPNDGGYHVSDNTRSNYYYDTSQNQIGPVGFENYSRPGAYQNYGQGIGPKGVNPIMQNDFQNIPMSQQARQQLTDIRIKATQYLQELKNVRGSLVQQLNEEIKAHNRDKERRMWLQQQLNKIINQLIRQGKIPPHINFPEWYQQTDNQLIPLYAPLAAHASWNQVNADYNNQLPPEQKHFKQAQPNQRGWGQPNNYQNINYSPQKLVNNNEQQGFYTEQEARRLPNQGVYGPNQSRFQNYQQYNQQPYQPQPYQQQYQQLYQQSYPSQQPYQQSYPQPYPTQRYQNYSQEYQNLLSPGAKYYDNRQTTDLYGQVQRMPQYQPEKQGIRNRNQGLRRQQNQYIRNTGDDANSLNLKQRLNAAQRMAGEYARQMDRWRMEGKNGASYPGLLQLLDQDQKIRQQTLKLLKMKR